MNCLLGWRSSAAVDTEEASVFSLETVNRRRNAWGWIGLVSVKRSTTGTR